MFRKMISSEKQYKKVFLRQLSVFILMVATFQLPAIYNPDKASARAIISNGLIINYDHTSFASGSETLTNLVLGETDATLRGSNSTLQSPTSVGQSGSRNFYTTTSGLGDNFASSRYIYTNTGLPASKFDTSTVSAFAWVRPTTADHVVLEERGSAWNQARSWYDTQIEMVGQKYSFRVWNCPVITSPSITTLNSWHYVGFTYNGSVMKAYIDGVQVSTDLNCQRELPWSYNYLLYYGIATNAGTDMNSSSNNYGGFDFGALHVYKRAISPAEVSSNYSTKLAQSITLSSLGTSSKSFPYSQSLNMSTSGSSGTGAITYAIASSGSTATGCTLSSSASNATLTADSSGTCLIVATIAADADFNTATSSATTFTFSKATQTLTFATTSYSKTFGETQTVIATSAGSGAITYSVGSSTACTVSGSTVTITAGSGTCVVTATRAADNNYFEATSSNSVTFTVSKAAQATLTLTSTSTPFLTNLRLTTSGGSDTGTVSFAVSSAGTAGCSIVNSDSLTSTSAGTCQIVATKLGTTNYLPASDTQTVTISKANLVLTTSVAATLKYGSTATASYSADRSVGEGSIPAISGALSFETSTSTACNINSGTGVVTMNRASGTCSIRVRLINDTNYQDTSSALVAITPAQADAISVTALNRGSVFTGSAAAITPGFSVTGLQFSDTVTVTYLYVGTSNAGAVISSGEIPSAAGSYSIIPMVTLTNSDSYTAAAITSSGTLTISRAPRSVSPSTYSTSSLKYGESATVVSNATSPSTNNDGEFTYSVGSGCAIDTGTGTVTAANYLGTCSATTTIQQGFNYESATATAVSFTLSKADTITVTATSPAAVTYTGSAAAVTPTVSVTGLVAGDSATGATFNYSRAPSCASGGTCQVGDTGPGGGKVFYVSGSVINAVTGISSGGIYLEMAPSTFSKTAYNWCEGSGNPYTTLFGATATTIGSGAANTKIMIDNCTGGAGVQAVNLTLGGQSDWFLPSYGELVEIYSQRTMLGLGTGKYASTYLYWSSTEADTWIASSLVPWSGVGGQNKAQATPYLPIRAFSPTSTTYESPTSTPTNAGTYRITPSALTLSGGVTTDYYIATVYETGTFAINKATQAAFTNYSTLSGVLGLALPIVKFGGSGDGVESIETTNGSATGCAFSGTLLSATAAGTCSVSASKDSSENFTQSDAVFSVNFFYFVPAPAAPVSTRPTEIAIATTVPWSATATAAPKITSISPTTGPVGTVITITGTGLNGITSVRIGRRALTSVTGVDPTSVTAVIPAGATTGPIVVSNSFGSDFIASGFTVTP